MPSRKKKYNARFPAGRIKKIMQMDDDVGKIAHAVPVVISRSVELFINSLLNQTAAFTRERNAKTLSLTHTKHCILKDRRFDFLKDLVKNVDDVSAEEEKKLSRSNSAASSMSQFETTEKTYEASRKRIKSEPPIDESSQVPCSGDVKPPKRRYSSTDQNCNVRGSRKSTEGQSTACNSTSSFGASDGNFDNAQMKTESLGSRDLIIDEDGDT